MSKRKNISKKVPIGRTLQTRDEYLASGKDRENIKPSHKNKKELYRRVGVVDSNLADELAVVKLTTKGRHSLEDYLDGRSTYKAFIEIYDNNGKKIKIDNIKFIENKPYRDISKRDVNNIKINALISKNTSNKLKRDNRKTLRELKNRK